MSATTTTVGKWNPRTYKRELFAPQAFSRTRAEIVQRAHTDRKVGDVADDPTLLAHYLRPAGVRQLVQLVATAAGVPERAKIVVNAALAWHVGRGVQEEIYLLSAADVDAGTPVMALVQCVVEPNAEATRCYDTMLANNPLAALGAVGTYGSRSKPVARQNAFGNQRREQLAHEEPAAVPLLSPDKQVRLDKLIGALPDSASVIYEALCRHHLVTLEMLLTAVEKSSVDVLTRWRMATVATNSYHLAVRVRGYVRQDFVRYCTLRMRVRGEDYFYVGGDCVATNIDMALTPPDVLARMSEMEMHVAPPARVQRASTTPFSVKLDAPVDSDDEYYADAANEGAVAAGAELNAQVVPERHLSLLAPPPAPLNVIVETIRYEHLLDLLSTELHLDTAAEDVAGVEETEQAAKHRLLALLTVYDLSVAAEDGFDEQTLIAAGRLSEEDLTVTAEYPRGYYGPQPAAYANAPGLRSYATRAGYAALGLGILCIVVRERPPLLYWLLYAESILMHAKKSAAELRHHLDGIVEFVAHTDEPDADSDDDLVKLIDEMRGSIAAKLPGDWHQRMKAMSHKPVEAVVLPEVAAVVDDGASDEINM